MKIGPLQIILLVLLALGAGWVGSLGAKHWSQSEDQNVGVHSFVHEELDLDQAQETRLSELEGDFSIRRQALDLALRSANADLAAAIEEEHQYGPKVSKAIEAVHVQMGLLQKATVEHLFKMRTLLNPAQQKAFDERVSNSLTAGS
jgi:Spy/CpxP family protein refolding chaperone|tara:strand:+ start:32081 stop:32518 length:438 start_codon:yes stop_codon:yes gene_type:complete